MLRPIYSLPFHLCGLSCLCLYPFPILWDDLCSCIIERIRLVDLLLEQGSEVRVLDNLTGGRLQNLEHHKANPLLTFHNLDITTVELGHPIFSNVDWLFHMAGIGDIVPSI